MRPRTSNLALALLPALACLAGAEAVAASKSSLTDFGPYASNLQLNNAGQVAGNGQATGSAFLYSYSGGQFTSLAPGFLPVALSDSGTPIDGRGPFDYYSGDINFVHVGPGVGNSSGTLVGNSSGTLVGSGVELLSNELKPIEWMYTPIAGAQAGSGALSGQYIESRSGSPNILSPGDPTGRGTMTLLADSLTPRAINDNGIIVGSNTAPWQAGLVTSHHAFVMGLNGAPPSGINDLGTLGGATSSANAINNAGQIVGNADTAAGNSHAFFYANGKMSDLGTLPNSMTSTALGLNDKGDVVGSSGGHAFLFSKGIMEDLNDRLPATSGLTLDEADKINNAGQIIAYGHGSDGVEHGYLLSPSDATATPEPSTLALLGLAAAGYGIRRHRNSRA